MAASFKVVTGSAVLVLPKHKPALSVRFDVFSGDEAAKLLNFPVQMATLGGFVEAEGSEVRGSKCKVMLIFTLVVRVFLEHLQIVMCQLML